MLISDNSPLRRLPANLNPQQTQFCDGLRFAVQMADIADQQLTAHLIPFSGGQSGDIRVSAASPFLFAWSIIDSAHRLRGLVENFPNLAKKNQSPEFRNYLEKAVSVETLRNAVQHMDKNIPTSAEAGEAVWGTLTWVSPKPQGVVYTCLLVSGAMMPGAKYSPLIPAGLTIREPLDHVTLTAGKVSVNLTEVMEALARLVGVIEDALKQAFSVFPDRAGSDMWIALAGHLGPNNTWVIPAQGGQETETSRASAK